MRIQAAISLLLQAVRELQAHLGCMFAQTSMRQHSSCHQIRHTKVLCNRHANAAAQCQPDENCTRMQFQLLLLMTHHVAGNSALPWMPMAARLLDQKQPMNSAHIKISGHSCSIRMQPSKRKCILRPINTSRKLASLGIMRQHLPCQ